MNKNILIAVDSFKGTLSSKEIGDIFKEYFTRSESVVIADGGEGSLEALQSTNDEYRVEYFSGSNTHLEDEEQYYLVKDNIAYIETALISGLKSSNDVLKSSSFGVGLALRDAHSKGYTEATIFLGGTGSNDGGMGLLSALGYSFLDKHGQQLIHITENIGQITNIVNPDIKISFNTINLISDVINPLVGERGATKVFGPQKGAHEEIVDRIEKDMVHFSKQMTNHFKQDYSNETSSGAAGGIPYALMHINKTTVTSGIEYIANKINLESKIKDADVVITGEGRIDEQSFYGKAIQYIIELCHRYNKPYILICGINQVKDYQDDLCLGIFELMSVAKDLNESLNDTKNVLNRLINEQIKENLLK